MTPRTVRSRRRARRRRGPRARRRDDVHPLGSARLPDVRRRGQGRAPDAAAGRAARADGGVRRGGDGQADPPTGAGGADCGARCHQRDQRDRAGAVRRIADGGRRAAGRRRTAGAAARLQELDQPPIIAPISKLARTIPTAAEIAGGFDEAFTARRAPPTAVRSSWTCRWTSSSTRRPGVVPDGSPVRGADPDPDAIAAVAWLLASAQRPVLILGTDVWADGAEGAALDLVEAAGLPAITNGMGRGVIPGGHPLLVTKARGQALNGADLVVVAGTPLDFRLGLRRLRRQGRHHSRPRRAPGRLRRAGRAARGPRRVGVRRSLRRPHRHPRRAREGRPSTGLVRVGQRPAGRRGRGGRAGRRAARAPRRTRSTRRASTASWCPRLADDAVVIGDGGDFVSFAGKYVEPKRPGGWLDPGPYGCLGAGLGASIAARIARPSAQVVLLLGDGAAGFSLMDVDTLVRHDLPVVMVMGNNSAWGLEKGPMQMIYGYDVAADLQQQTRYDEVVKALGGAGETVTDPRQIGAGHGPGLRLERAVPRQRDHRRRRGLPARHVRHLSGDRPAGSPCGVRRGGARDRGGVRGVPAGAGRLLPRAPAGRRAARPRGRAAGGGGRRRDAARDASPRARRGRRGGSCPVRARARASSGCSRWCRPRAGAASARRWCGRARSAPRLPGRPRMWLTTLDDMAAAQRIYARLGYRHDPSRDWFPDELPDLAMRAWTKEL